MTKEQKERLSNRLVFNFGVLLAGALLMLYVNSAIKSTFQSVTYIILLVLAVLGILGAMFAFFFGKAKGLKLKNYSPVFLGVGIASIIVYLSNFHLAAFYTKNFAVSAVYIAMLVYFIILAIYTGIMMRKPLIKDSAAQEKAKSYKKKKNKKR